MHAFLTSRRAAIAAAGGLVAALAFGGVAQAITDTVFRYSTPKTGFYSIDKYALNPIGSGAAEGYIRELNNGLRNITGNLDCFATGVNLPHGATLSSVRVRFKSGLNEPEFYFLVQTASTGAVTAYQKNPIDSSGQLKDTVIAVDPLTIDNSQKSYAFMACINASDNFFSARIAYTYNTADD